MEESAAARAFVWAGAAVAAAAIVLYGQSYLVPVAAIAMAAWGHRSSYRRRHQPRGKVRQLLIGVLIALCVVYLVLDSTQALFGGQLPQAHFALLLLAVTSFDLKTRRNLYSSLWISLALLYLAAVFAWDLTFGLFSLAWFACLAGFWLASYLGAQTPRQLRLPPRPAISLGVAALLVGVGAFALAPQPQIRPISPLAISLPGTLQLKGTTESPALPLVAISGSAGTSSSLVNLHFRGSLGDSVVMYVRSGAPAYWTGQVLDVYQDGAWSDSDQTLRAYPGYVGASQLPQPSAAVKGTFVQTFRVVAPLPSTIYAAAPVQSIYFPNVEIGRDAYGGWHAPAPLQPGQTYSVVSYVLDQSPATLRQAPAGPGLVPAADVDASALTARGQALADAIVRQVPDDAYDRVAAVTDYLQHHYAYTQRLPPVPPGQDPVDWFLFGARRGYCEQFASAEVLMLRSLGIPARLVTGYSTGEYNPVLDEAVVREHDAHAWVQVFFPGPGWVPFDPSPGFSQLPASQVVDRWATSGLGFLAPRLQVGATLMTAQLGVVLPLLVLILVAAAVALGRRRVLIRERAPRSELLQLYERAQRRLGRRRQVSETPLEYWNLMAPPNPAWRRLTDAVNEAVYGGRPPSRARLEQLREELRG